MQTRHFKLFFSFILVGMLCTCCTKKEHRRILVIHSYEEGYAGYPEFNNLIERAFQKRGIESDLRIVYLDCENHQSHREIAKIKGILDSAATWKPEIILVNEDQATYSLLKSNHRLARETPIVFGGVNYPDWNLIGQYPNVTGFHDKIDFKANIDMARNILKSNIDFFTIIDSTFIDMKLRADFSEQIKNEKIKAMNNNKNLYAKLIPVMLCFFAMGFVDLVGIASNYVKADLDLTDSQANVFPSLVFFWFLIFSVPTGVLMNKIGRKKTVLLSLIITFASLLIPVFGDGYTLMLISFSLLGIGNALMQTSLNPLLSNIIAGDKLASTLTFGQFVKAIASFLAPYIAMWGATQTIPSFGLGWRVLFPVYMVIAVLAIALLGSTPIEEEKPDKASGFKACFALLGKPFILLSFIGIMCHVGIDVGTNTTAPKILMERLDMTLAEAGFATSLYFIFRTVGCFLGAFILQKVSAKSFFALSVVFMLLAMAGLFIFHTETIIYICIAMIGFGNSNVFSIIFSQALFAMPDKKNEVSGLMIMGLFGGTVFPLAMGVASDAMGQSGAVAVMTVGVIYLLLYTLKIKK